MFALPRSEVAKACVRDFRETENSPKEQRHYGGVSQAEGSAGLLMKEIKRMKTGQI